MRTRHDSMTQTLHWAIALLIVADYILILIRQELPRGTLRTELLGTHMSIGMAVFVLILARLAWRFVAPKLEPLAQPRLLSFAGTSAHVALYAMMIALPLVGLVSAWMKGRGIQVFGLFPLPSPFLPNKEMGESLEDVHEWLGHGIMALAGIHAFAALFHHYYLKDKTLVRMLPSIANR